MNAYRRTLFTLALYYMVPPAQIVFVLLGMQSRFAEENNPHLYTLTCHYNQKCKKTIGNLDIPFNNVISNIGYVLVGLGLMWYFRRYKPDTSQGVFRKSGIYYAIALATIWEGCFSAFYHVCPCIATFQFDATMMFFIGGLMIVAMFHKRHGLGTVAGFKFFTLIFFCFAANTADIVLRASDELTQERTTLRVICVLLSVLITVYAVVLYYWKHCPVKDDEKMDCWTPQFAVGVTVFSVNLAIAVVTIAAEWLIFNMVLGTICADLFFCVVYYFTMKLWHGERIRWTVWLTCALQLASGITALYFYRKEETDSWLPLAESNALNNECSLFGYFDRHDIWHFLSAAAIGFTTIVLHDIDLPTHDTPREETALF